ncbi:MAG: hypothetical protein HYY06_16455 [Deltaproteobacteria bacterium]|nr:hypothetical protein [Deltaproteobacteria bacterium]
MRRPGFLPLALFALATASCEGGGECGNGVVEQGEACDLGPANAEDATCKPDCTPQTCGDGALGAGEGCDGPACECAMLWARTIDGVRMASDVAVTAAGNIVLAGERTGEGSAIWIRMTGPDGSAIWTRTRDGGQAFDRVLGVAVDPMDQVAATGGEVLPDSGEDMWAERLGPNGEPLWVATYAGAQSETERGLGIAVDGLGNAFVLGGEGSEGLFVRKLDPEGAELWTERISSVEVAPGSVGIATDSRGDVAVLAFEVGTSRRDLRIRKYRSAGSQAWVRFGNGAGADGGADMATDPGGNVLVVGAQGDQLWIRKIDPAGEELWTRVFDAPPGADIAADAQGNIVVAGTRAIAGGRSEIWVVRMDPSGNELWTRTYPGAAASGLGASAEAIAVGPDGEVVVVGHEDVDGRGNLLWVGKYPP